MRLEKKKQQQIKRQATTTSNKQIQNKKMSLAKRRVKEKTVQEKAEDDLAMEIARAEKEADDRFLAADKRAKDEAQEHRDKTLQNMRQWGSTLFLFPMIPALFGVVTICVVSVVSNTDNRQADGNLCNGGYLNVYLLLSQVLAYFFLFGYGCMFIGTKIQVACWKVDFHCSKLSSIVRFYIVTVILGVGINGFGAWALATSYTCSEPLNTPYTYRVAQMEAAFFWMSFICSLLYGIWFNGKKKIEAMAIEKKKRELEDNEWEAEEAERKANAQSMVEVDQGGDFFSKEAE